MRPVTIILLVLISFGAIAQNNVELTYDRWVARTWDNTFADLELRFVFHDSTSFLDDSVYIAHYQGGIIFRGLCPMLYNGVDTAVNMKFTQASVHPCKDSGVVGVRHYLDLYDEERIMLFVESVNDPCPSLNNLLRNHIWVQEFHPIPDWFFNDTIDTINSIGEWLPPPIRLHPNPASDFIFIDLDHQASYELFDMSGRVVWSAILTRGTHMIDVRSFPAGVYSLTTNGRLQRRIIIQPY